MLQDAMIPLATEIHHDPIACWTHTCCSYRFVWRRGPRRLGKARLLHLLLLWLAIAGCLQLLLLELLLPKLLLWRLLLWLYGLAKALEVLERIEQARLWRRASL